MAIQHLIEQSKVPKPIIVESGSTAATSAFTFLPFGAVLNQPPKRYLVRGMVGRDELTMLFGDSKAGKSLVILDMAAALVRGAGLFAEAFEVYDPITVCYATGEGQRGLPNRFRALENKWRFTEEERERFITVPEIPNIFDEDEPRAVANFVTEFKERYGDRLRGGLLIIDTFARAAAGADENTAKDTTVMLEHLSEAQRELGCSILVLHHAGHSGRLRGSSNIQAAFDAVLAVRQDTSGDLFLGCSVAKDAGDAPDAQFAIRVHTWLDEEGMEQTGGYIDWLGTAKPNQVRKSEAQRTAAEISELLQERATSEAAAVTAKAVAEWMQNTITEKTAGKALKTLSDNPSSVFKAKQKPVTGSDGKQNRNAWHYWAEVGE